MKKPISLLLLLVVLIGLGAGVYAAVEHGQSMLAYLLILAGCVSVAGYYCYCTKPPDEPPGAPK